MYKDLGSKINCLALIINATAGHNNIVIADK